MGAILTVKDLNVTYINKTRRVMAVRRASFSIDKGDSLGIVGESGSGKSTLAMALLRLHPKSTEITGEALFDGKDLFSISEAEMNELRWMKLAVVFQKAMNALSPVHRIGQFLSDIYLLHRPKASKAEAKEAGCKTIPGIGMLLWQGAEAFRLFTGKEMPAGEVMERYFRE